MKRLQLAIFTILLSFQVGSVIPDATERWVRVQDIMFESPTAQTPQGYSVRVRLYYTDSIKMDMVISNGLAPAVEVCDMLKGTGFGNQDINGRKVSYNGECLKDGVVRLWPKYRNQTKYAIDEFLTKDRVHLGATSVGTEGFVDAYGEIRRFASFME